MILIGRPKRYLHQKRWELHPTEEDLKVATDLIKEYLDSIDYGTPAEKQVRLEEMLKECTLGWHNAKRPETNDPKDRTDAFMVRIRQKIGPKSVILQKKAEAEQRQIRRSEDFTQQAYDKLQYLEKSISVDDEERAYMMFRYKKWLSDFDLSSSADGILLDQIITDELLLRRLDIERMNDHKLELKKENQVEIINQRYRKNLELLGVTRKQRVDYDTSIEGNVAELSMNVEKKLDKIKDMSDPEARQKVIDEFVGKYTTISEEELLDYVKDLEFQRRHDAFPEKNFVSEAELIGASDYSSGDVSSQA